MKTLRIRYLIIGFICLFFTSCNFYEKGTIEHLEYYEAGYLKILDYMLKHHINDSDEGGKKLDALLYQGRVKKAIIDQKEKFIHFAIEDGFGSSRTYNYFFTKKFIPQKELRRRQYKYIKVKDRWYFIHIVRFGSVPETP